MPTVSPWISGSYSSPGRLKPTSFDLNVTVSTTGPSPCPAPRARASRTCVVGCRSVVGVQLVLPLRALGDAGLADRARRSRTPFEVVAAVKRRRVRDLELVGARARRSGPT